MSWTSVPVPPAPTGINEWPTSPPAVTCWEGALPDEGNNTITSQTLTVTGIYQSVLQATASPSFSINKTITYEKGASFTQETETEFGLSLGIQAADFATIGANLTQTTSYSTTLYASTTTSYDFILQSTSESVSVCVWQLVYTYTINGTINISGFGSSPFTYVMVDATDTFSSTQYPAAASVTNLAGGTDPGLDRLFPRQPGAHAAA
jgi:hypothetical protein